MNLRGDRQAAGRWDGWACALVVLVVFLCARPYVEMGLVDDFSYVKTAWVFAATGKLVYNGWATAMLGWQIPLAAVFVKVLGPTFFACRVSITLLLVLTVVATHAVMRRAGLRRGWAAFGALVVGLSPLTMAMSATFMTDVAGMFVIVVCLVCAMRALRAETRGAALGWIAAGFMVGAVGGTARQIAWMAPLVMMPCAAWLLRGTWRGVVAMSVGLWVVTAAVMLGSLRWFKHQMFSVPEPLIPGHVGLHSVRDLMATVPAAGLCLVLLMLPVLAAAWGFAGRLKAKAWVGIAVGAVGLTWVAKFLTLRLTERGFMPWTGDIVERMDVFDPATLWMPGAAPVTMNHGARVVGSVVVIAAGLLFLAVVWRRERVSAETSSAEVPALSWRELGWLLVPFCCAYCALLLPRGIWAVVLDRYLLPLLVVAAVCLLRVAQERLAVRVPRCAWAVLVVVSLWSLCGLHDWIAGHRARLVAVAELERAGVTPTAFAAGYEFDGMTQIDVTGAVADERVRYPFGLEPPLELPAGLPKDCEDLFQAHTPSVHPVYFLAWEPGECLAPSEFAPVEYRGWLPPFRRFVLVERLAVRR